MQQWLKPIAGLDLPDDGFTERVMLRIDSRHERRVRMLSRVWTAVCSLLAFVWLLASGLFYGVAVQVKLWFDGLWLCDIPQLLLLAILLPAVAVVAVTVWGIFRGERLMEMV